MSTDLLRGAVLIGATLTTGLVAGAFVLYAHTLMPGLRRTDDRTFVAAFAALDRAIINPWFLIGGFLGAPVLTAVAAVAEIGEPTFVWVVAALVLDLVAVGVTGAVHLPLNDALKAAADGGVDDPTAVRREFGESRWARWNLLRGVSSTAAFAGLAWALVLFGRSAG